LSQLICNLPAVHVWVRKEFLRDHEDGHGEFVKGVWISCKSMPGRAFYFETYLPDYGAMFDKLPISAFTWENKTPEQDLSLPNLQFWNCMDYGVVAIHKQFISSLTFEVMTRNAGTFKGKYVATIDNYHSDINTIDYSTAETPAEHKSHNLIELENGQFGFYPNNRMRIYDNSLTPDKPLMPDFKVSTIEYEVENEDYLARYGDSDDYFYKSKDEK
jgi:hypothetical protein